ncbi:NADPH:quinone oxidoreductase family protein [Tsuneonella sp. CC-YZS046]|uniref:NADPH:quinone oxidoreductase family protein n=1 Tax=Tsuneonella sp. CC-YZS046 TaxID=3042152 RepID=UPI002D77D149|nr:NADPH:quinone oxidoreductase family protein [Tsuneonella sp. CC-YZS046]WRO66214.1 NADPH:quinone oxidoreductase family protein [Tsuneonella sp. CC-YZS046]
MKAWLCERFADPFELVQKEVPLPQPGPGEVRVRVRAAGLAFGETLVLEGGYQKLPPLPYIPSSELSGIVDACGPGVTRLRVGDRVAAFSVSLAGGGLAEYCVLPERFVHPVGDGIDLVDAAGFLMNHWTAFNALVRRAQLLEGETLVVFGATGGVGCAAMDVGRALGARVIAVGSDTGYLKAMGADLAIDYRQASVSEQVREFTGGRGADVYFDPVGGDLFDQAMKAIAPGGRILVVGFTSGRPATLRTNVALVKMISVIGVEARLAIEQTGEQGWADFNTMLTWAKIGKIRPQKANRFPFDDALQAFRDLRNRKVRGKCVVVIDTD